MKPADEVVPAQLEDYVAVAGCRPPASFQGFTVRRNGAPVAVAGIYAKDGMPAIFSVGGDKVSPKTVVRVARMVLTVALRKGYRRLFALRDAKIPTSDGFMRHYGFEPAGMQAVSGEEVYEWRG